MPRPPLSLEEDIEILLIEARRRVDPVTRWPTSAILLYEEEKAVRDHDEWKREVLKKCLG